MAAAEQIVSRCRHCPTTIVKRPSGTVRATISTSAPGATGQENRAARMWVKVNASAVP
jgi:hypothetical protein